MDNQPKSTPFARTRGIFEKTYAYLAETWVKLNDFERTNMETGVRYLRDGNYFDAALRFKYVLWRNKDNQFANYLLGKAYIYGGKPLKAIEPLKRAIAQNPNMEEAQFLLAAAGVKVNLVRVPPSLVHEQHESMANNYDQIVSASHHRINEALREELLKYYGERQGLDVLVLSCRGGDMAEVIRTKANRIIGVEMSLKMSALARNHRLDENLVFSEVINKYPLDYLRDSKTKYDLIIATFFVPLFGDLTELIIMASEHLNKGGVFAFNFEKFPGEAIGLNKKTLSFMHSANYMKHLCEEYKFIPISEQEVKFSRSEPSTIILLEKA